MVAEDDPGLGAGYVPGRAGPQIPAARRPARQRGAPDGMSGQTALMAAAGAVRDTSQGPRVTRPLAAGRAGRDTVAARHGGDTGPPRPGQTMHAPYYDRDADPVSQEQRRPLSRQPGYRRAGYADASPARPAGHRDNPSGPSAPPAAPRARKRGEQDADQALRIWVHYHVAHVLITVTGEIDITTAPQLRGQLTLLAAGGRPVIADLTEVTFIDAAGLGVLAAAAGKAAASGGSLHVVSDRYQARRVFALTGLDRQIPLARTLAEAVASLPAGRDIRANGKQPQPGPPGLARTAGQDTVTGEEVTG